jgi:co-chaperonin GroES (HSP10)
MVVKAGDTVVFSKYGGTELQDKDANKTYLIIKEQDILAVQN